MYFSPRTSLNFSNQKSEVVEADELHSVRLVYYNIVEVYLYICMSVSVCLSVCVCVSYYTAMVVSKDYLSFFSFIQ